MGGLVFGRDTHAIIVAAPHSISHVDKLMNYIRFWQASGESIKTATRTKTRLAQLTEEGIYTGETCPLRYELYDNGRVN